MYSNITSDTVHSVALQFIYALYFGVLYKRPIKLIHYLQTF